jgi:signal transduction histidine kinase
MAERIARDTVVDIAHDFNGPLSTMLLETLILERRLGGDLGTDTLGAVRSIQRSIEVLTAVIGDLMDLSRIAEGTLQLQRARADLHALVERAMTRTVADAEKARVVLDPGPAVVASVDVRRLERVVANLVATAIGEANGTSRIAVGVSLGPTSARIAIAADVPDPRPQPEAERRRVALGLHIGKKVVEAHGGRLLTGDARFVIELPHAEQR